MDSAIKISAPNKIKLSTKVFFVYTLIMTMLMGFVDEGYYDFSWMSNIGNWVALSIYFLLIFGVIYLLHHFISKKMEELVSVFISIPFGTVIGFVAAVVLFTL
jgi:hypothetical protein